MIIRRLLKKFRRRSHPSQPHRHKPKAPSFGRSLTLILLLLLVLIPALYTAFTSVNKADAWYATGGTWLYRKRILVDDTKVSGTSDMTNFPMLVSIVDPQLAQYAQQDGDDILFTDQDGTKLDHEIEAYDYVTGKLVAWVEATLDGDEDTVLYMYYGESTVSSQQSVTGVWGGYLGVWHLNELSGDEATTTGLHQDSTSTNADGTQTNNNDSPSQIANGQDFDNATNYITMGNVATFDAADTDDLVISGWFNRDTFAGDHNVVANRNGQANTDDGYIVYIDDTTDQLIFEISEAGGTDEYSLPSVTTFTNTGWVHFVIVWDQDSAANSEVYINGADDNVTDVGTIGNIAGADGNVDFQIGSESDDANIFDGRLDEIRITKTIPTNTSDYIATEYNNQMNPSTFYTLEGQETQDGLNEPVMYLRFDEGRNDSCPSGGDTCDATLNKNDGAFGATTEAPSWQSEEFCVSGKCLNFDGADDNLTVTNSQSIDLNNPGDNGVTLATWVKVNTDGEGNTGQIFSKGASTYCQTTNEGGGVVDLECSFDLATTPATATVTDGLSLNKWHHIAMMYDDDADDEITVYIDGISRAVSTNGVGSADADANNLIIGNETGGTTKTFDGFVDEFRFYDVALTDTQMLSVANTGGGIHGNAAILGQSTTAFLNQGLAGYWPLDETSTPSVDYSGNDNDGTWNGGATNTSGKFSNSLSMDGNGDYSAVTDQDALDVSQLTIAAWVYPTSLNAFQTIAGKNSAYAFTLDSGANGYLRLFLHNGTTTSAFVASTNALTTNTWQHVAATFDGSRWVLYKNGEIVEQQTSAFTINNSTSSLLLGLYNTGDPTEGWAGRLDEARLYNRALSPEEMTQLYNWGPSPVAHWKFDENADGECTGGTNDVCDSTINANDGAKTTMSATNWIPGKFGASLDFDGSDDYVEGPTSSSLLVASGESLTITTWFKIDTINAVHTFLSNGFTTTTGYFLRANTFTNTVQGKIEDTDGDMNCNNQDGLESGAFTIGVWNHAAFTWDDGTGVTKIYLNGKLSGTCTDADIDDTNDISFVRIGKATSDFLDGTVDEMRVYNYARSQSQILEDMNAGHPVGGSPAGSSVVNWKFDEGTGTTAFNSFDQGPDGTLANIASPATTTSGWTASGKYNKALIFDGSDDVVSIADASDTYVNFSSTDAFSLCSWVNISTMAGSSENDLMIGKWDATTPARGYRLYVTNDDADSTGNFRVELYDESADQTISAAGATDSVSTSTWYHVCSSFNGGTAGAAGDLKLFVNGSQVASNAVNASFLGLEDVAADFTVGEYDATDAVAGNTAFTGTIDAVQVYSTGLTAENVRLVYNANASLNFSTGQNEDATLTDGAGSAPVLVWDLNENTSTTASDTSGNGLPGTLTNSPKWTQGKYGGGVRFVGSDQHIIRADDDDLDFAAADSFTIESWFRHPTATAQEIIVAKHSTTAGGGYKIITEADGDVTCAIDDDTTWTPDDSATSTLATYDDDKWHHVACVKNGTTSLSLYIDGVLVETDASIASTGTLANANDFYYGIDRDGTSNDFTGSLDQLVVYRYVRTPAQIAYDYNRGAPLAHWKQDEIGVTTATATHDATTAGTGSGTSLSFSHTVASQNNRILLAWIGSEDGTPAQQVVSSVTYNSVALTQVASKPQGTTSQNRLDLWYLLAPATGANTLSITFAGNTDGSAAIVSSYYNLAQQAPEDFGIANLMSTQTTTASVSAKTRGSLIADAVINNTSTADYTPGPGQTEHLETGSGFQMASSYKLESSIGPNTMLQTHAQTANPQVHIAAAFAPVTTADKIQDSSGNNFTGTMTNMETADLVEAKYDHGLDYDGTDEYVSVSDNVQLRFDEATRDFSLFAWVKRDANGEMNILSKEDADNDGWRLQFTSGNAVRCSVDAVDVDSSSTITDTSWHFVGCTIDRDGNGQVYIDGLPNGSATAISSEVMANTSALTIGTRSYTSTNYLNGIIDDVRIYNYALSAAQVRNVMNLSAVRFGPQTGLPD